MAYQKEKLVHSILLIDKLRILIDVKVHPAKLLLWVVFLYESVMCFQEYFLALIVSFFLICWTVVMNYSEKMLANHLVKVILGFKRNDFTGGKSKE